MSTNYTIVNIPHGVHCIINAWEIGLRESITTESSPSFNHLCKSITEELTIKNFDYYNEFVPDTTNIAQDLKKYLHDGDYASPVEHLVPYALANITETYAMIYIKIEEGEFSYFDRIEPHSGKKNKGISLLKSGKHYDLMIWEKTGEGT